MRAAEGRWPDILASLAGLSSDQLTDRHQPCPACGGTDRFRWDDDSGDGSWFCNQCGGKNAQGGGGNGMDLLMRVRGWSFTDACRELERHLGLPPTGKPRKPHRIPERPPADAPAPPLNRGAVAQWCYRDASGAQLFWIQRISLRNGGKAFLHRVWLDGGWHRPSREDPFTCDWPAPRPLLNLDQITARPTDPILITEGEKACDAAQRFFPAAVASTWPNGAKALDKIDLKPLSGRTCILWPDNDPEGTAAMDRLGQKLLTLGCKVQLVSNPPDAPEKWDLADAKWTPSEAQDYIRTHRTPFTAPTPEPPQPPPSPDASPFHCLGFDGDAFFYQPAATGQVIRISASGHSGINLCRLAPLTHWEALYPGRNGINWTAAASDLFAQQADIGVYDPDRIRGRGAWWDEGRAILHLGDHLLVDGLHHDLTSRLHGSRFLYQRLAAIDAPPAAPLSDPEAFEILELANRFYWDVPASGLLLAGWVTLAPICGALDWRPHAWLTAAAGSGKSELLDKYVGPLLGSISLWPLGSSTEAFLRQQLRCDALPVVFDEAESNENNDKARIQAVLALARVASSSGRGVVGRGSADGQAQRFTIRSMFLLSSISTALKQGADRTRFAQLSLRNPSELPAEQRSQHWANLKADLERTISNTTGQRLQARTISLIAVIRQSTRVFREAAGAYFQNQRLGDQYGTLLAGAYALQSSQVPNLQQATDLISQQNWEPYQQATELTDEQACLQTLLQHQLRIESRDGALTRTVAELVAIAAHHSHSMQIDTTSAEELLGRHGFRVADDHLLISNTATAIGKILSVTPWASCWPFTLVRVTGATRPGVARFKGIGSSRCVGIPLQAVTL
jgi:putative DNA primase/helicase